MIVKRDCAHFFWTSTAKSDPYRKKQREIEMDFDTSVDNLNLCKHIGLGAFQADVAWKLGRYPSVSRNKMVN